MKASKKDRNREKIEVPQGKSKKINGECPDGSEESKECSSCLEVLTKKPYILCAVCSDETFICLKCFSRGKEFEYHSKDHDYQLCTSVEEIRGISGSWSASEELKLIDAVLKKGHGNWQDVADVVGGRSASECKQVFDSLFVDDVHKLFPSAKMLRPDNEVLKIRTQPSFQVYPTTHPCRPLSVSAELCGYNAFRGDFNVEPDNKAELDLCHPMMSVLNGHDSDEEDEEDEEEDKELLSALELSLGEAYNDRLRERARIKRVVCEFNLLNKHKLRHFLTKYEALMDDLSISKQYRETLLKMARLWCAFDFDFCLQGLKLAHDLAMTINQLSECRENGLRHMDEVGLFRNLKRRRLKTQTEAKPLMATLNLSATDLLSFDEELSNKKRRPNPLDIVSMKGYGLLESAERDICSQIRLEPEKFLELKTRMMKEREKLGRNVKLKEARVLFKIDVHKTRRLVEFWNNNQSNST